MFKIKNRTINFCLKAGFFLFIAQLVTLALFWLKLPPQVPLFYSRPWGKEQLINPPGLLLLPILSLLIAVVNLIVAFLMPREEKLSNQLLVIFAAVFNFLSLVTLFKIVTLVT